MIRGLVGGDPTDLQHNGVTCHDVNRFCADISVFIECFSKNYTNLSMYIKNYTFEKNFVFIESCHEIFYGVQLQEYENNYTKNCQLDLMQVSHQVSSSLLASSS